MWKEGCATIQNNKIYNIIFPQCHNAVAEEEEEEDKKINI